MESLWEKTNLYQSLKRSEELDEKTNQLHWIQEAMNTLESSVLSDKYRYSQQIPIILWCLKESFGNYINDIQIVNRLLVDIEKLLDAYKNMEDYIWEKNWVEWEKIIRKYNAKRIWLIDYFSHYWILMYNKLEENNKDKWAEEIMEIVEKMEDKFIQLLLKKVKYIPE